VCVGVGGGGGQDGNRQENPAGTGPGGRGYGREPVPVGTGAGTELYPTGKDRRVRKSQTRQICTDMWGHYRRGI